VDSVILAWFASIKKQDNVIDIGAGSGVISALLCRQRKPASVTAVEIQDNMYSCLEQTIEINNLCVVPIHADIKSFKPDRHFSFAICNPPYRKAGTGRVPADSAKRHARFDDILNMDDVLSFCRSRLLFGSRFAFSGEADRLPYFMAKCAEYSFEPKRLVFLHHRPHIRAKIFFLETVYGAGCELTVEPPVIQNGKNINNTYHNILQGKWD
jgi:tRNA1Val (adenine37-N6)-methyltransferase